MAMCGLACHLSCSQIRMCRKMCFLGFEIEPAGEDGLFARVGPVENLILWGFCLEFTSNTLKCLKIRSICAPGEANYPRKQAKTRTPLFSSTNSKISRERWPYDFHFSLIDF